MTAKPIVKLVSGVFSLISVIAIAISTTLSFWFIVQYAASIEHNRGLIIFMAYVGLISGYYGIAPLSTSVQEKTEWILYKIFGGEAADSLTQPDADALDDLERTETPAFPVSDKVAEDTADAEESLSVDIEILITRHDGASNPDLPSHLFPGSGSDGAKFSVQGMYIPSYSDIDSRLSHWDMDCCLVDYDENTGQGYFRMVDADAPAKGTLVVLKPIS